MNRYKFIAKIGSYDPDPDLCVMIRILAFYHKTAYSSILWPVSTYLYRLLKSLAESIIMTFSSQRGSADIALNLPIIHGNYLENFRQVTVQWVGTHPLRPIPTKFNNYFCLVP